MEMSGHEFDILRCLDEGMSFDEIAQELDMTAEQVYEIGTAFFDRAFATWTKGQDINRFKTVPLTLLISFAN
jgi:hypothetical protein